jgi:deaminated glutathione amidase
MERFVAAAIQMTSNDDRERNLAQAIGLIDEAVSRGAQFVALPENVDLIAAHGVKVEAAEPLDGPTFRLFSEAARERNIWLLAGTVAEISPIAGRARNTSVLFNPRGDRVAVYRKIHLFDVDLPDGSSFRESQHVEGGTETVVADTSLARFGLSVCYDLRFPELYRELSASGAEVLLIPSAFTLQTGKDHWEVLLRARAIENSCWVIAPAQTGRHLKGRASYGHTMIIDPWGIVVARCSDGPGVCIAVIDPDVTERTRRSVPSLQHRRVHSL